MSTPVIFSKAFAVPLDFNRVFQDPLHYFNSEFRDISDDFLQRRKDFLHLSIYEIVEQLIRIFLLDRNEGDLPFIQAFQNIILRYMEKETSDILVSWNSGMLLVTVGL